MRRRTSDAPLVSTGVWALERLSSHLTVQDLADHAHLRPATLSRRWRAETGLPPLRWLTLARVEHAKEMLERTDMTPADIARTCGFGSRANFRHRFRRETGLDPAVYRAEHSPTD